jgi:hypothetical protein
MMHQQVGTFGVMLACNCDVYVQVAQIVYCLQKLGETEGTCFTASAADNTTAPARPALLDRRSMCKAGPHQHAHADAHAHHGR